MKKTVVTLAVILSVMACKQKATNIETARAAETTHEKDAVASKQAGFKFEDYKVDFLEVKTKATPDFNSNPLAKEFKTAITEQYNHKQVDFAGNYIVTTWGCGTSCLIGVLVDIRDGKIYDLPTIESSTNFVDSKKDSNLMLTSQSFKGEVTNSYWKWNETTKTFKLLKKVVIEAKK